MNKKTMTFVAFACLLVCTGFGQSNQNTKKNQTKKEKSMETHFNKEQQEVFNTIIRMVNAFEKKDIDGVLATYEPGAIVMFEPQKPVQGKENLRAAFTQFVTMNPIYTFSSHEVYVSGDIATHLAPWKMTGELPDGTKIQLSGLSVAVLRKQKDGTWLMIQDNPNGEFLLKD